MEEISRKIYTKNIIFFLKIYIAFFILMSTFNFSMSSQIARNVLGGELKECVLGTGYYRDGHCNTGENDYGVHVVCSVVTDEFLKFTESKGNDLITPRPNFLGLKKGDHWCLCAFRFEEARKNGFAPRVILEATHEKALEFTSLDELKKYSI